MLYVILPLEGQDAATALLLISISGSNRYIGRLTSKSVLYPKRPTVVQSKKNKARVMLL